MPKCGHQAPESACIPNFFITKNDLKQLFLFTPSKVAPYPPSLPGLYLSNQVVLLHDQKVKTKI